MTSWRGFTPRSWVSVEFAMRQPSCSGPMMRSSGTNTSVKNTSLNSDSSVIWRSGRTSTPGARMSTTRYEMPLLLRRVGIGAGEAHAPVGELRVARPHLLPVEQPAAVDAASARVVSAGEVAARARLAEELAPELLGASRMLRQPARLLLGRAVGEQRRARRG